MKKLDSVQAINNLRAKADIAEEVNKLIDDIRNNYMYNGEIEYDWQIETNNRYQAKIDVLQSLIDILVG